MSSPYDDLEPTLLAYATFFHIAVRVAGAMSDKHTVIVLESRYDRVPPSPTLFHSHSSLVHALQLPPGNLLHLHDEISKLVDQCRKSIPTPPEVILDVTRSPLSQELFPGNPTVVQLINSNSERWGPPYRYLGRLLLLSSLQVLLRDRKLRIYLPTTAKAPMVSSTELERALSTVQSKMPQVDLEEALLTTTGPDDDLALTFALGAHFAQEHIPDPVYRPDAYPHVEKPAEKSTRWIL